ncbi:MAG: nucleoside triphosphate pyrophosphohydrolase [Hyphomicrobiales bacterium]|nr:nucleoside triphosphate pyrophosphohydrolase [Hyphomicrobiales bacterium]
MDKKHPKPPKNYDMGGLRYIMRALRDPITGCEWDLQQDFNSIGSYTIEEAYEVMDAIHKRDYNELAEELGDLLLQPIFHAQIAEELGLFDFEKVVWNICDKMIRRHPHVFTDKDGRVTVLTKGDWQRIKAAEKVNKVKDSEKHTHLLDDVPHFPALKHAQKLQEKAAKVGFDWPHIAPVKAKIFEELNEFFTKVENGNSANQQAEFGDLLFSLVNYGRHLGIDSEQSLQTTNGKFINRFNYIEDKLELENKSFEDADLDGLEILWQQAKGENL